MDNVYLSPKAELTTEDATYIAEVTSALEPTAEVLNTLFESLIGNSKPFVNMLGVYLNLDYALIMLDNYRSLLIELVADFEELNSLVIQLSETIKACESIQEQITYAACSVYSIDEIIDNPEYNEAMVATARVLSAQRNLDISGSVQLELPLEAETI